MSINAIPNPKKTLQVEFSLEKIKHSVKHINIVNSKYHLFSSDEIFNQYTYSVFEVLSLGAYIDIGLNQINENKTEITIEVRRKIGSFNQPHEVTNANNHIVSIIKCISKLTSFSDVEFDDFINNQNKSTKPTNELSKKIEIQNIEKWYNNNFTLFIWCIFVFPVGVYGLWKSTKISILSKSIFSLIFLVLIFLFYFNNNRIGNYKKEKLPINFSYNIIKDESNIRLEKNQLYIQINEKLSEGQIASLAEEIFDLKEEQRRFYIFYVLNDNINEVWATSHFDPELEINIVEY